MPVSATFGSAIRTGSTPPRFSSGRRANTFLKAIPSYGCANRSGALADAAAHARTAPTAPHSHFALIKSNEADFERNTALAALLRKTIAQSDGPTFVQTSLKTPAIATCDRNALANSERSYP